MNAVHSVSLFCCKARWFSRGIFVKCIYAFRDEIAIFLEKENGPEAEKFRDDFCVVKLSYLVDIFEKLNMYLETSTPRSKHAYICWIRVIKLMPFVEN
jgi:hypothetical protein